MKNALYLLLLASINLLFSYFIVFKVDLELTIIIGIVFFPVSTYSWVLIIKSLIIKDEKQLSSSIENCCFSMLFPASHLYYGILLIFYIPVLIESIFENKIKIIISIKPLNKCLFSRRNGYKGFRFLGYSILITLNNEYNIKYKQNDK